VDRPELLESPEEVRTALEAARGGGRTIALVPTMGALHAGHLSLVREARRRADVVVVSIFVNPTQFVAGEDFETYPRDLDADVALLGDEQADFVFHPSVEVMYPAGADTTVVPGAIGDIWCGVSRPGHFTGVATIVTKLFGVVRPDVAVFGEKDFQQLRVIEKVVRDLDLRVRVMGCPIVRERDGVAMSSRNAYLTPQDRKNARILSRALCSAQALARAGATEAAAIAADMGRMISGQESVELDYATVVDAETLECLTALGDRPARALVAARVGPARLIDNVSLTPAVPLLCE
jgi:pantoate--beta-alanine ligase